MSDTPIVRIAARGDGATADGRHFPLVAPGDLVADDGSITPGPHRRDPACVHFPACGGCQLQQIDDSGLAQYCHDRVVGALAGQGLVADVVLPPHLSPPYSRRRASLKAVRTHKGVAIGFNAAKSAQIVDMSVCAVLDPRLFALVAPLRKLIDRLLPKKGLAEIAMTMTDQGVDLSIKGIRSEGLAAHDALLDFAQANMLARLSVDDGNGPEDRWAPEPVTMRLGGVPVGLPHDAFLQATADGEAALLADVLGIVGDAAQVADLFAGLGTFALPLSTNAKVLAVEGARDAALALQSAVNRHGRAVRVEHRDLYRRPLATAELAAIEAVVLDPPRAGAEAQVRELAASRVSTIAYVSCNPASFARDAAILVEGGYRVAQVRAVGQFRWSTHVELVAKLVRG